MISISIIIPAFNRLKTLPRALASVVNQSLSAREIIVVDDGSTDHTAEWISSHYPQIHVIRQNNHGVSHARNRGIESAKGEWIALLDSDDAWQPDKLEKQIDAIKKSGHLLCHTNEIWIRDGKRVNAMNKHQKRGGDIFHHCLPLCCISPSSALIHHDVFKSIGLFNENLPACEDYDFWLRFCARHAVTLVKEAVTIKYGGHADQLSKQHWGMDRFRVQALDNLLNARQLDAKKTELTKAVLRTKLNILKKGAIKHNNIALLDYCNRLASKHPAF